MIAPVSPNSAVTLQLTATPSATAHASIAAVHPTPLLAPSSSHSRLNAPAVHASTQQQQLEQHHSRTQEFLTLAAVFEPAKKEVCQMIQTDSFRRFIASAWFKQLIED